MKMVQMILYSNDIMDDDRAELILLNLNQNGFNKETEIYFNENGSDGIRFVDMMRCFFEL